MNNDRFTLTKSNIDNRARADFFSPFSYLNILETSLQTSIFLSCDPIVLREISYTHWPKTYDVENVLHLTSSWRVHFNICIAGSQNPNQ